MKVFLSYAVEDKPRVDDVYRALRAAGLEPLMDKPPHPFEAEGVLTPGRVWDQQLRNALKNADVVLAFLSRTSVAKKGYVQREFRLALQEMNEAPAGHVYLVPVKLEPCDVPEIKVDTIDLRDYQWFDLQAYGTLALIDHLEGLTTPREPPQPRLPIEQHFRWNRDAMWNPQLSSICGLMMVYMAWLAKQKEVVLDLRDLCNQLSTVEFLYAQGFLIALRAANLMAFSSNYTTTWRFHYVNPLLIRNIKSDIDARWHQAANDEDTVTFSSEPYEADLRTIEDYIAMNAG